MFDLETQFKHLPKLFFKRQETIVRAGEPTENIYYVDKGFVRQFAISVDGDELTLNNYKPKSYFYIPWLFKGGQSNDYFEALTNVTVHRAPLRKIQTAIKLNPELLTDVTRRLARGLQASNVQMESLAYGNAASRVAAVIFNLANRFGEPKLKNVKIRLPLTHKLIASIAGLSRETTSLEIEALEKQGILRKKGPIYTVIKMTELKTSAQVDYDL